MNILEPKLPNEEPAEIIVTKAVITVRLVLTTFPVVIVEFKKLP